MTGLPPVIENVRHIPRVEFDLSYNKTLRHDEVFQVLAGFPNLCGLGLIKNEMGVLPESIGQLENLEMLELWSNGLKKLPDSFKNLKKLEYLNLRNNSLKAIPACFSEFKHVKSLNLQFNKIKKIPDFIFDLTGLEYLNLGSCGLKEIPSAIGRLSRLKTLVISKNNLKQLPDEIRQLKNLEHIAFEGNDELNLEHLFDCLSELPGIQEFNFNNWGLTWLPESIGNMRFLRKINLERNKLETLPASMAKLNLEEFKINDNPWKIEKVFPILAQLKYFKSLHAYNFPEFKGPEDLHLPASIGDFQYLEEISLAYASRLVSIHPAIGRLSNLKSLNILQCPIRSLPETIGNLKGLERLSINENTELTEIPERIYSLSNLKYLAFNRNGTDIDLNRFANLAPQEKIMTSDFSEEFFQKLKALPQLREIQFNPDDNLEELPDSFFDIEGLDTVQLFALKQLRISRFLKKVHRLKSLKTLHLGYGLPVSFDEVANGIKDLEKLESLFCTIDTPLNARILELAHLKELHVTFRYNRSGPVKLPPEYAFFPENVLNKNGHRHSLKKLDEIKTMLKHRIGAAHPRYLTLYFLMQKDYASAIQLMQDPFDEKGKIKGAIIYITARPSSGTMNALQKNLEERGATISKTLDEKVTHLFLTPNLKDEDLPQLIGDYQYIMEDHLKEREIEEDTPYLMEPVNEELVNQVTALMKAKEEDRTALMLELIEGGGATPRLVSYLGAIHLFHTDVEIRKKSRNLFRKFASSALQQHVKKVWRDGLKNKNELYHFKGLLNHPEWDGGAFIHAWKMVKWHQQSATARGDRYLNYHYGTINIQDMPVSILTSAFKDFDYLQTVVLRLHGDFDWDFFYELIKDKAVKRLFLQQVMPSTPHKILELSSLEQFHAGVWGLRSIFDLAAIETPNTNLKELNLNNCDLKNAGLFSCFPNLEKLTLSGCTVDDITGIAQLSGLKYLNLSGVPFACLDRSFEKLSQLQELHLSANNLERIDLNFPAFKLTKLSLQNNPFTSLPDTFEGCERLTEIFIQNTELESLPASLFKVYSGSPYPSVRIKANKNKIKYIGNSQGTASPTSGNWSSIDSLELMENALEEIPPMILQLPCIKSLTLSSNPIRHLPDVPAWNGQIENVHISNHTLEEIPAFIFGKKTHFGISLKDGVTRLPHPDELPGFFNVKLSASYGSSDSLKKAVDLINTKLIQ